MNFNLKYYNYEAIIAIIEVSHGFISIGKPSSTQILEQITFYLIIKLGLGRINLQLIKYLSEEKSSNRCATIIGNHLYSIDFNKGTHQKKKLLLEKLINLVQASIVTTENKVKVGTSLLN